MSSERLVRVVYDVEEARRTLLRREPFERYEVSPALQDAIESIFGERQSPDQIVKKILDDIRSRGDRALKHYSTLLDGPYTGPVRVEPAEIERAWLRTSPPIQEALRVAADRIEAFHQRQYRQSWLEWDEEGGAIGQIVRPLERVGIYAPHGRAPYPSSLLMAAIPARVAGVSQVVVATPPRDGQLNDTILAAAYVAKVDEVYALGGAQAIGALAFGTESVPRVDKILGPGNIFVVLAKRQVFGVVDIESLPGPTETLLIADDSADPRYVAADMLAQAEHDPLASALLITTSAELAQHVEVEIHRQLPMLSRQEVIRASLAGRGGIVVVEDLATALELANEYAPEHLCLLTRDPWDLVGRVRNAGGVFVGEYSSEALGDYVIGPSHIMPTGQTARFSSPVNVWDFVKITSVFAVGPQTARKITPSAVALAEEEGLTAHARAMQLRFRSSEEGAS